MEGLRTRGRRPLASLLLALLMLVAVSATASAATLIGEWKLKGNFRNAAGTNVKLAADGPTEFQTTNVNGAVRKALVFDAGEGVSLSRVPRSARSSYSILITFEFDAISSYRRILSWGASLDDPALYTYDGHLYLYDYIEAPTQNIVADEWSRILITRDGRSGLMRFYVDGRLRIAFVDYLGEFRFADGRANFFNDNGSEESGGSVANIRLYRGVLSP